MNKLWIFFWCSLVLLFDGTWQMGLRLSRRKEACCYFALNGHYPQHISFYTPEELNFHRIWKLTDKAIQHTCFPLLRRKLQTIFRPQNPDQETYYKMRDFFYNYRRWSGCRRSNIFGEYIPMEPYPYPDNYEEEVRKPQTVMQRFGPTEHNAKPIPTKPPKDSPKESFMEHVESEATEDSLEITIGYEETSDDSVGFEDDTSEDYVPYPDPSYKDATVIASDYDTRQGPSEYEDEIFKGFPSPPYQSHKEKDFEKVLRFNPETTSRESLQDKDLKKIESSETEEETKKTYASSPDHAYRDKDSTKIIIDHEATAVKPAETEDNIPEDFISIPEKSYKDENLKKIARARSREIVLQESDERTPEDFVSSSDNIYKDRDSKKIIIDQETTSQEPSKPEDSTPEHHSFPSQSYKDGDVTETVGDHSTTSREYPEFELEEIASYPEHSHKDKDSKKIVIDQETISQEPSGPEDSTPEELESIPDHSYKDEGVTKIAWDYPTTFQESSRSEERIAEDIASYLDHSYKDEDSKKIVIDQETTSQKHLGPEDSIPADPISIPDYTYKDEDLVKIARDYQITSQRSSESEDVTRKDIVWSPDHPYKDEDSKKIVINQETTSQEPSGPEDSFPDELESILDHSYKDEDSTNIGWDYPTTSREYPGSEDISSEKIASYPDHFYKDEDLKKIIIDQETTSQEPSEPEDSIPEDPVLIPDYTYKDEDLVKTERDYPTTSQGSSESEDVTREDIAWPSDRPYKDEDSKKIVIDQETTSQESLGSEDETAEDLVSIPDHSYRDEDLTKITRDDLTRPQEFSGSEDRTPEDVITYSDHSYKDEDSTKIIIDQETTSQESSEPEDSTPEEFVSIADHSYKDEDSTNIGWEYPTTSREYQESDDRTPEDITSYSDQPYEDEDSTKILIDQETTSQEPSGYEDELPVDLALHPDDSHRDEASKTIAEDHEASLKQLLESSEDYVSPSYDSADVAGSSGMDPEAGDLEVKFYSDIFDTSSTTVSVKHEDLHFHHTNKDMPTTNYGKLPKKTVLVSLDGRFGGVLSHRDEAVETTTLGDDEIEEDVTETLSTEELIEKSTTKYPDDVPKEYINVYEESSTASSEEHTATTYLETIQSSITENEEESTTDLWAHHTTRAETSEEVETETTATEIPDYHNPWYSLTESPDIESYSKMTDDLQNTGSSMTQGSDENHPVPGGNHSGSFEEYDEENDHTMTTTLIDTDSTPKTVHEVSYRIHKGDEDENKDEDDMAEDEDRQDITTTTDPEDVDESIEIIDDSDEKSDDWLKSTSDEDELNQKPDYSHYDDKLMAETTKTPYENDYSEEFDDEKFEEKSTNILIFSTENYREEQIDLKDSTTETTEEQSGEEPSAFFEINEDQKQQYSEDFEEQHQGTTTTDNYDPYDNEDDYVGITKVADHYETSTKDQEPTNITEEFGVYEYYPNEQKAITEGEDSSVPDRSREYEDLEKRIGMVHEENVKSNEEIGSEHSDSPIPTEDYYTIAKDEDDQYESTTDDDSEPAATTETSKDYENYPREQKTTTEEEDSHVTYRSQEHGDIEEKLRMIHEGNLEFDEETMSPIATGSYPHEQEATMHEDDLSATDHSREYEDIEEKDGISHNEELKSDEVVTSEEDYSPNATEYDYTIITDKGHRSETPTEDPGAQETIADEGDPTATKHIMEYKDIGERVGVDHEEELKSYEDATYQDNTGTTEEAYSYKSTTRDEDTTTTNEQSISYERFSSRQETTTQEDDASGADRSKEYEDVEERVGMINEETHEYDEENKHDNKSPNSAEDDHTIASDEPYRYESTTEDVEGPTTNEGFNVYESYSNDQEATTHEDDSTVIYQSKDYENIEERIGMIHKEELEHNEDASNEDYEYPDATEDDNPTTSEEKYWYYTTTKDRDTTTTNEQTTVSENYSRDQEITTEEDDSSVADHSKEYDIEERVGVIHKENSEFDEEIRHEDESTITTEDYYTTAEDEAYGYKSTTEDDAEQSRTGTSQNYEKYIRDQETTTAEDDSSVTYQSREYEGIEERIGMIHDEEVKSFEGASNEDNEHANTSDADSIMTTEGTYWYDTTTRDRETATTKEQSTMYDNYRSEQEATTQEDGSSVADRSKEYGDIEERVAMIHEEELKPYEGTSNEDNEHPSASGDEDASTTEEAYWYSTTTKDRETTTTNEQSTMYDNYRSEQEATTQEDGSSVADRSKEYGDIEEIVAMIHEEELKPYEGTSNEDNEHPSANGDEDASTTEEAYWYDTTTKDRETTTTNEQSTMYDNYRSEQEANTQEDGSFVADRSKEYGDIEERVGMIHEEELKPHEDASNEDNEHPNASEDEDTSTTVEAYWYDTTTTSLKHPSTYENYPREQESYTQEEDSTVTRSKEYRDIEERVGMINEEEFETDTDTTYEENESPEDDDRTNPTEEAYHYETPTDDEDTSTVKEGTTGYESYTSKQEETTLEEDSVATQSDEYFDDRIRIATEDYYYFIKGSTNEENKSTIATEDVSTATTEGGDQYETTEGREDFSLATEKSEETSVEEGSSMTDSQGKYIDIDDRGGIIQDKEYRSEEETTVVEDDYTSTPDSPTASYEESSSVTKYTGKNEDIEERQDTIGEDHDSDEEIIDYDHKLITAAEEENHYTVENEGEDITSGYDSSIKYEVVEDRIGEIPQGKSESEEVASSDGYEDFEKDLTTEYTESSTKSDNDYKSAAIDQDQEDQQDSTTTAQEEDTSQAEVDTDLRYEDFKEEISSTVSTEPVTENEDSNGTATEEMSRTTEEEDTLSEEEHTVEEIEGRIQNSEENDQSFLEVEANPEADEHETSRTGAEDQVNTTEEGWVTDHKEEYEDFVADKEEYRNVGSTIDTEEKPYVMKIPPREPDDSHLAGESYEDATPGNQEMTESEQVSAEIFNQDPSGSYDDDKKDPGSVSTEGSTTESGSNTQNPSDATAQSVRPSGQTTTKRNKSNSQPTKPLKTLVKKIKEEINSRTGI